MCGVAQEESLMGKLMIDNMQCLIRAVLLDSLELPVGSTSLMDSKHRLCPHIIKHYEDL